MTHLRLAGTGGPRWRARLETRWQAWVREVTDLSLAYLGAAAASPDGTGGGAGQPETQALLHRTVAARRKLADVEEALDRLPAGISDPASSAGHPSRTRCSPPSPRPGTAPAVAPAPGQVQPPHRPVPR